MLDGPNDVVMAYAKLFQRIRTEFTLTDLKRWFVKAVFAIAKTIGIAVVVFICGNILTMVSSFNNMTATMYDLLSVYTEIVTKIIPTAITKVVPAITLRKVFCHIGVVYILHRWAKVDLMLCFLDLTFMRFIRIALSDTLPVNVAIFVVMMLTNTVTLGRIRLPPNRRNIAYYLGVNLCLCCVDLALCYKLSVVFDVPTSLSVYILAQHLSPKSHTD